MKLTTHFRDDNDQVLCRDCAKLAIWKLIPQRNVEESPATHDPLECSICSNIILTVEEAAAKAHREAWQRDERRAEQERLAYCGYED